MNAAALGNHFPRIVSQRFRLRQKLQRLDDLWIAPGPHLQAFFLAESVHKDLASNAGSNPIIVLYQIRFGIGNLLFVQKLAEVLQHYVVDFELVSGMMRDDVMLGEIEECIMLQK